MVLDSQVQTPWIRIFNMCSPLARSTEAPCFLQGPGQKAEAGKAGNAWRHPHETVRTKQQPTRTRQKPGGPSPEKTNNDGLNNG